MTPTKGKHCPPNFMAPWGNDSNQGHEPPDFFPTNLGAVCAAPGEAHHAYKVPHGRGRLIWCSLFCPSEWAKWTPEQNVDHPGSSMIDQLDSRLSSLINASTHSNCTISHYRTEVGNASHAGRPVPPVLHCCADVTCNNDVSSWRLGASFDKCIQWS